MAATQYAWDKVGPNTTTQASLSDMLDEIETLFGSANHWSVSETKTSNGGGGETLEVKCDATGFTSMRVLFFGGAAPDADASAGSTLNSSHLYICGGPSLGTTGPDVDFTTGHPYSGSAVEGVICGTGAFTNIDRIELFETEEFFVLVFFDNSGTTYFTLIAGNIYVKLDDTLVFGLCGCGVSTVASNWDTSNSSSAPFQRDGSASESTGTMSVYLDGSSSKWASAIFETFDADGLTGASGGNVLTAPIPMWSTSDSEFLGILRQIKYGPDKTLNTEVSDSDTTFRAYVVSSMSAAGASIYLWQPTTV